VLGLCRPEGISVVKEQFANLFDARADDYARGLADGWHDGWFMGFLTGVLLAMTLVTAGGLMLLTWR